MLPSTWRLTRVLGLIPGKEDSKQASYTFYESKRENAMLCTEGKVVFACKCIGLAGDNSDKVALNKAFQCGNVQLRERSRSSSAKNSGTGIGSLTTYGEREQNLVIRPCESASVIGFSFPGWWHAQCSESK